MYISNHHYATLRNCCFKSQRSARTLSIHKICLKNEKYDARDDNFMLRTTSIHIADSQQQFCQIKKKIPLDIEIEKNIKREPCHALYVQYEGENRKSAFCSNNVKALMSLDEKRDKIFHFFFGSKYYLYK